MCSTGRLGGTCKCAIPYAAFGCKARVQDCGERRHGTRRAKERERERAVRLIIRHGWWPRRGTGSRVGNATRDAWRISARGTCRRVGSSPPVRTPSLGGGGNERWITYSVTFETREPDSIYIMTRHTTGGNTMGRSRNIEEGVVVTAGTMGRECDACQWATRLGIMPSGSD